MKQIRRKKQCARILIICEFDVSFFENIGNYILTVFVLTYLVGLRAYVNDILFWLSSFL